MGPCRASLLQPLFRPNARSLQRPTRGGLFQSPQGPGPCVGQKKGHLHDVSAVACEAFCKDHPPGKGSSQETWATPSDRPRDRPKARPSDCPRDVKEGPSDRPSGPSLGPPIKAALTEGTSRDPQRNCPKALSNEPPKRSSKRPSEPLEEPSRGAVSNRRRKGPSRRGRLEGPSQGAVSKRRLQESFRGTLSRGRLQAPFRVGKGRLEEPPRGAVQRHRLQRLTRGGVERVRLEKPEMGAATDSGSRVDRRIEALPRVVALPVFERVWPRNPLEAGFDPLGTNCSPGGHLPQFCGRGYKEEARGACLRGPRSSHGMPVSFDGGPAQATVRGLLQGRRTQATVEGPSDHPRDRRGAA